MKTFLQMWLVLIVVYGAYLLAGAAVIGFLVWGTGLYGGWFFFIALFLGITFVLTWIGYSR